MYWYWKARIYHPSGDYSIIQIETERDLRVIDTCQDFYKILTGEKLILEGMQEKPYEGFDSTPALFKRLWGRK